MAPDISLIILTRTLNSTHYIKLPLNTSFVKSKPVRPNEPCGKIVISFAYKVRNLIFTLGDVQTRIVGIIKSEMSIEFQIRPVMTSYSKFVYTKKKLS